METFEKAKLEILNYVITFCTNTIYDGDKYMPPFTPGSGFTYGGGFTSNPQEVSFALWLLHSQNGIFPGLSR